MNAHAAMKPPAFMHSDYGPALQPHVSETLESMISVPLTEFFPDFAPAITSGYPETLDADLERVRQETRKSLALVDMSSIAATDSVNILASEHGFGLMGGWPYAEMIKTIREVVMERTGCNKIHLRLAIYRGFKEAESRELAGWMCDVLDNINDEATIERVKQKVLAICARLPVYA